MSQGKTTSRVAMALMCGLAICCAVMYVTADGQEVVLSDTSEDSSNTAVYGMEGPSSVATSDVIKAGTIVTNTPDGRMRLTSYLTNVETSSPSESPLIPQAEVILDQLHDHGAISVRLLSKLIQLINRRIK